MNRASHVLTTVLLVLHAAGALVFSWLAPHGFPVGHARFWLHSVLPVAVIVGGLGLCVRPRWGASVLAGFWLALASGFVVRFAEEGLLPALFSCGAALAALIVARRLRPHASGLVGLVVGLVIPFALGAPPPSTRPGGPDPTGSATDILPALQAGQLSVILDPRLTVHDASRTGFQTIFGPAAQPIPSVSHERIQGGALVVETRSTVHTPVFAHLSTYSNLQITGLADLSVVFSPCPATPFTIEPSDYPWGRPQTVAYVTDERRFVVARARTAEKGPFTTLCEGRLEVDDTLSLTFYDADERPVLGASWLDYSSQISTELSPSAGYGLPQNALTFSAEGFDGGIVFVHLTLASTGVGIGWDSVGLSSGGYTNRVILEDLTRAR
jgi:hypothetical protein